MEPDPQQPPSAEEHDAAIPGTQGAQVSPDPGSGYLITVQVEPQFEEKVDADVLHRLAMHVLKSEGAPTPLEVGVVVTTDEEVHTLNRQYLGHDYQTDVISFGMAEEGGEEFITPEERPRYLGDVVISYDRAAEQAPEYEHSTEREVATLLVHGLLHLLGYDDTTEAEHEKMHEQQDALIWEFGIRNPDFESGTSK
ncbi:MAG: putative rRNA maturation factor [Chloroflexia bacterium]|jgi:probable rRNA maturation factor|nr:putative rRNA maturation factor [Chloroflexia bacterium]